MINSFINDALDKLNVSPDAFSELLIRLLDYGVICRDESLIEEQLYDRYLQCQHLIEEYLQPLKVRIQHDKKFAFVRVYPPGAVVPGLADQEDQPFSQGFRTRPNQQEVAVILVLRAEYDKALRDGQIDENGCVLISLEALAIALHNLLKRQLPDNSVDRKQLFRRLRQLRLINFNNDEFGEGGESWLRIRPSITSFVSEAVLSTLANTPLTADDTGSDQEATMRESQLTEQQLIEQQDEQTLSESLASSSVFAQPAVENTEEGTH